MWLACGSGFRVFDDCVVHASLRGSFMIDLLYFTNRVCADAQWVAKRSRNSSPDEPAPLPRSNTQSTPSSGGVPSRARRVVTYWNLGSRLCGQVRCPACANGAFGSLRLAATMPLPRFATQDVAPDIGQSSSVATQLYPSSPGSRLSTSCVDLDNFDSDCFRSATIGSPVSAVIVDRGVVRSPKFGVASLTDLAEVAFSADLAGNVTVLVTFLADPVGDVADGMTFQEKCGVRSGSVCDYDDYCGDGPDYCDYDKPGDFGGCPGVRLLTDPVSVVTDGMMFQEKYTALSGSVYDYDDYCDDRPDYFDYDEPGDFDSYPNECGFIEPNEYEHDLHGLDDCGMYCVSQSDAGVSGIPENGYFPSVSPVSSPSALSTPGSPAPGPLLNEATGSFLQHCREPG